MNMLSYIYHYRGGGGSLDLVDIFITIIIVACLAGLALYAIATWVSDAFLNKFLRFVVVVLAVLAVLLCFTGCKTAPTAQQSAVITTAGNLARIAAEAAATYYGGPAAGQLAAAGLDALAVDLQAYIGQPIPAGIVKASPGVKGVGTALVPLVAPNHVVTQADADKVAQAARIAALIKPAVVVPNSGP